MIITVVIPTYQRNESLALCLERLAPGAQTLAAQQYRVIVTDDGRTTTAESMIRERFPWATWQQGPQRGPAANRNSGARGVTTDWIVFTDDDCVPSPQWLSGFADAIEESADIYEGRTTCVAGVRPWVEEAPINESGGQLWSCNMMVRRSRFEAMAGFDERFPMPAMEDVDLMERATRAGVRLKWTPAAVIDHPPRRRRGGWALGKVWENRVLFVYKHQIRRSIIPWLPLHIASLRAWEIRQIGFRREAIIAAWNVMIEWWYVVFHVRGWDKKYRAMFAPGQA